MRSRYSAFAVGDMGYLLSSWHPSTRPESMQCDPAVEWRRLRIRDSANGGADDAEGTVDFVAHYWDGTEREYGRVEENSRFVRLSGSWVYLDAST